MFQFIKQNKFIFLNGIVLYALVRFMMNSGGFDYVIFAPFMFLYFIFVFIPSRFLGDMIGVGVESISQGSFAHFIADNTEFFIAQIILLTACIMFFFLLAWMKKNLTLTKKHNA